MINSQCQFIQLHSFVSFHSSTLCFHTKLESVTFHMLLPFLVVKALECDACMYQSKYGRVIDCGKFVFESATANLGKCATKRSVYTSAAHNECQSGFVGPAMDWQPAKGVSLPVDWLRPLKRIKQGKKITHALLGTTFMPKHFSFHPLLISIYKV